MNQIFIGLLFVLVTSQTLFAQVEVHKIYYEDTTYMALGNEEYNTWYVKRKKLIKEKLQGKLIVYYDKSLKDTAIMVTLVNGDYEGLYREWNREKKYVSQECVYENGYRKDKCRDYVYLFPQDEDDWIHKDSILIEIYEYECFIENGFDVQGDEVIKYKNIHRSEYERAVRIIRKED